MPASRAATGAANTGRGFSLGLIAVLVAITAVDAMLGPDTHLALFLGIIPLIGALRCSRPCSVVVATVYVLCLTYTYLFTLTHWATASRVVGVFGAVLVAVFSIVLCRIRLEREVLYARTSLVADVVQRAMMRELPLTAGPLRAFGFYVSAQEGARVGGDIYEAVDTPFGRRVMIGDVQGKGVPAIGAGHEILASFREAAHHKEALEVVAERMEQALTRYNTQSVEHGAQERFATALLLELREDGARALSCGHISYFRFRHGEIIECTDGEGALPLGLGTLTGEPRRGVEIEPLADDWILLCTDGVTEARGADGSFYPLRERLARWTHLEPAELARTLRADLEHFSGGELKDDATLLVVRREP
ncbi:PP2C family protein-serine/threonine phosphatase [Streptomyces sp. MST-110588]|uniref:PP2C family protein-serine/threonine phosphatase n=1 Tax=Streptomyces sp. MST-110588 TaxID=2833628 RepID=UPI001F5DA3B5|nr:PP2C family protein-serine/threonine phosphatase [Streptomyces sp. MST-110588]UNO40085.1 serine/threonine-protein phosphatase [Streptomyces sp. MST-110588]